MMSDVKTFNLSIFFTGTYLDQCLVHRQPRIPLCYPACSLALEVLIVITTTVMHTE